MPETKTDLTAGQERVSEQVAAYSRVRPRYAACADALRQILEQAGRKRAPLCIAQARAKAIASFAEKIQRRTVSDPVNQFTDLCGARVIVHTPDEMKAMCDFIEKHFAVDWDNSDDVSHRLKPMEFGYRSVHYIVQFKPHVFPNREVKVSIPAIVFPDRRCPMKAEIQVRTLLEHAWADFTHDRSYKSSFAIPDKWQRELAGMAAMIEEADKGFARIHAGLKAYAASYGTYMTPDEMEREIEKLKMIQKYDPKNPQLAHRIGKLAMTLGLWDEAVTALMPFATCDYQPLVRDLGISLCKKHRKAPKRPSYRTGQKHLEASCEMDTTDVDAFASLAGTWKGVDEKRAEELYRKAHQIDPTDPYPLVNYLDYVVADYRSLTPVSFFSPSIGAAIQHCRDQAEVGMNMPWTYASMGKLYLLLGRPYESMAAYAKLVQLSSFADVIDGCLVSLEKLAIVRGELAGYEWGRRLLLLGLAAKFGKNIGSGRRRQLKALTSNACRMAGGPVVIVAGGCDASVTLEMRRYRRLMVEAFSDFTGTVISGGTTSGICELVGEVARKRPDAVHAISYLPRKLPQGAKPDKRYSRVCRTTGKDFSPLEPLQNWVDLLAAGIKASEVKVLGINGGSIAAAEYRTALALGAQVGVLEGSGREASKLIADDNWKGLPNLLCLPEDPFTVRAFIGSGSPKLPADIRETMAKAIHAEYQRNQQRAAAAALPSMADYDSLPPGLQESNRRQADRIFDKLGQIGCDVRKVANRTIVRMSFTKAEVEFMAEMEHARWNVERLQEGWKWGPKKDVEKKISPYLVSWSQLADSVKEWDRLTAKKIPDYLALVGLEIVRKA